MSQDAYNTMERHAAGLRPGSPIRDTAEALLDEVAQSREEGRRLREKIAALEEQLRVSRKMIDPNISRWLSDQKETPDDE